MSKPKLIVYEDQYVYRICWWFPDEGDNGAVLGDGRRYTEADLKTCKSDDYEHVAACVAASQSDGVRRDSYGYFWEERSQAVAAKKAANAAMKSRSGRAWPEWATKAAAAGWKAPKGWKP